MFLGLYRVLMGDERSVEIPADFRELLAQGAYITRGFEQNLLLMGETTFQEKCRRVASLNMADPSVRLLQRLILANAARLQMDASGRITIPPELAAFAGVQKDLVLIGQGDYLEAWSPEGWQAQSRLMLDFESNSIRFAQLDLTLA